MGRFDGVGTESLHLPSFQERTSLRHQVAHALRAALVAGEMRPGMVYSAPALAEQFGVSATPVREAMLDLAKEGLLEAVRNKGFRVTDLSERELDEITALRVLIEVPAVAEIARRAAAADDAGDPSSIRDQVEALRELAREIVRLAQQRDLIAYIEADRRFHLSLLEILDNRQLVELISNLRSRSRLYGLQSLAEGGGLAASAAEHEELLDHVLAGDDGQAARLMHQHINHVRGEWAGRTPEDRPWPF